MAKALREIKEKASLADLFIIVLDARAPLSTYNNEFDEIAPHKPRLFVLTKVDLADTSKLDKIKSHFINKSDDVILVNLKKSSAKKLILNKAEKLLEDKRKRDVDRGLLKPRLRAIVVGVPNSGKSTLINVLSSGSKTKVGNMPGVTKGQQWINTGKIWLLDTPGILWPKFEDDNIGIKLAMIGSIKTEIIPQEEYFIQAYKLLSKYYPNKLHEINLEPSNDEKEIYSQLLNICRDKKFLIDQNNLDLKKGRSWFINWIKKINNVTYD